MTACDKPGCGGTLDEGGYCDTCLEPVIPERPVTPEKTVSATIEPSPVTPPGYAPSSPATGRPADRAWWGLELVALPALPPVKPADAMLADPSVDATQRVCRACSPPTVVAQSHHGQEALLTGVCHKCGTPYSFVPKLTPGTMLADRYKISGCIGYGGLGWVFLAEDTHLNDSVALKGLIDSASRETANAAARELEFLTRVAHPNVVRVRDFVSHPADRGQSDQYIVMEYVRGCTVRQAADRHADGLSAEHVLAYCLQLLAALDHLHDSGWLHCDVKPDNVMVEGTMVKLIDLGAGCRIGTVGHGWGTPAYRAPEIRGSAATPTVCSDLFSAGRTLQTMFRWTGEYRDGSQADLALESLHNLAGRATADSPADRFQCAADMAGQLSGVLRDFVAVRTGRPLTAPASLFGPETALLDGTLGSIPALDWWTAKDAFRAAADGGGRSLPDLLPETPAAARLPAPRPDPADPAADLILTLGGMDPVAAEQQVTVAGHASPEADLLRCRAELIRGNADAAREAWARVRDICGRGDWRVRWHKALIELSAGDDQLAFAEFSTCHQSLPGEVVPRLGLGLCAEYLGRNQQAERYYQAIWQADHSYVSAAFGLARARMRTGDRAAAVSALDEVPDSSRYALAARIAAFLLLTGQSGSSGWPARQELDHAETRLDGSPLHDQPGEERDRLRAVLLDARLRQACSTGNGRSADVTVLRTRLDKCYRALASHAADRRQHTVLIDLANQVRARTLE